MNNQVDMAVSWGRGGGREGGSGSLPGLFLSLLCCDCMMQASSYDIPIGNSIILQVEMMQHLYCSFQSLPGDRNVCP